MNGGDHQSAGTPAESEQVEALLEEHLPVLLAYIRLHCPDVVREHESCADLVQSACREVLAAAPGFEFRGVPEFRKWLFQKVQSKFADRQRYWLAECRYPARELTVATTRSHFENLYATLCSPSHAAIARERVERFERAFADLTEQDQQVITLIKLHGMSHRQVAAEIGKSEGGVRVQLHRALGRLGMRMHGLTSATES